MSEEQLTYYKDKLCEECLDIAKDFIQQAIRNPDEEFGVNTMKETYAFKKEIIRRILITENVRFQKKHDTQGVIDLRKVAS
jgi:hypothetical protein